MSGVRWKTVSKHCFRRTAQAEQARLERLQTAQKAGDFEAAVELGRLNVRFDAKLRVSVKRWKGYWRCEQYA